MTAPRATVIVALMNSLSRLAPVALSSSRATLGERVDDLDWPELFASLDESGFAIVPGLVGEAECARLARLYDTGNFRSRVIMSRHGFGRGEYQYFAYPLPDEIQQLRSTLYSRLVPLANQWQEHSGCEPRFPERHEQLLARCHAAGQLRPTPLLLRYGAGDFTASRCSRCRWRCCSPAPTWISRAASSCSPNNGRASNHVWKWYRCARVTR
jgi:hypothetical protein